MSTLAEPIVAEGSAQMSAFLNILEDFAAEKESLAAVQRAVLNVLDDAAGERDRMHAMQRAMLNLLEDFGGEKSRFELTQKAMLNLLDDFEAEKTRLEATQRAMLNLLEDFEAEKSKVERANGDLVREVTERRQAEASLVERTADLGRSNAELEQFAYVASHDLQEPLRMVASYVQLFERRYSGLVDDQGKKYIAFALDGARRMQALIGGLLEYSRAGRQDVALAPVEMGGVLDQALANLRRMIEESEATITHDRMPRVLGEPRQLAQVMQNLVANAIKFKKPDVAPHVHVGAERRDDEWLFSVADNGIGMEPQYFDRIFVLFQRLHTRTEYPGTGIGLALCKKVVERHGGRLWVESTLGVGSTFRFTVPAAEDGS